jgi:hypothetical protein
LTTVVERERTMFKRYMHIERFGTPEVEGIVDLVEPCYVFPKLDGTNASVWWDGELRFGSRNRVLSLDNDNRGFMASMLEHTGLRTLVQEFSLRLFGEWLVPHSLKTYQDDAWKRFYIFDVYDDQQNRWLHYDEYAARLDSYGFDVLPPLAIVHRGTEERFREIAESNTYLMKEGEKGEGIVIKRYGFINPRGRTVWAKMVRSEFKTRHLKAMGPQVFNAEITVEDRIVAEYVTSALVEKEYAKIVSEEGTWTSRMIPRLLGTVFHCLVTEETWNIVKKFKNPTIDFKRLQQLTIATVKLCKPELF